MTTRLPDGSPLPATRGELMAARRAALGTRTSAVRSWLAGAGLLAVGLIGAAVLYAGLGSDGAGRIIGVVITVALVGAAAAGLTRLSWKGAQRRRKLDDWSTVDRSLAARKLPPGALPIEQATLFDLRDHAGFADAAPRIAAQRQGGVNGSPVLVASTVAGLLFGLGLLPLLGAIDSDTTTAGRVSCVVALVLLWSPAVALTIGAIAENRRASSNGRHAGTELDAYRRRRLLTHGEEAPPIRGGGLGLGLGGGSGLLALLLLGYLAVRLVTASALAAQITGAIAAALLVSIAIGVVVAWRRAARTHVVPFLTPGDKPATALTAPTREVDLEWIGTGLRITPLAEGIQPAVLRVAEVLGVEPMHSPGWWTDAVTVVTTDDVVVLAGKDIADHPAVRALDDATRTRTAAP